MVEACRLVAAGREEEEYGVAVLDGQVGDSVNGVAGRVGVGEALVGELIDWNDERVLGIMCHQRLVHLVLELELGDVHETLRDLAAGALESYIGVSELELVRLEVITEDHVTGSVLTAVGDRVEWIADLGEVIGEATPSVRFSQKLGR